MGLDAIVAGISFVIAVYEWRKAVTHWAPNDTNVDGGSIYGYSQEWSIRLQCILFIYWLVSQHAVTRYLKFRPVSAASFVVTAAAATLLAILLTSIEWVVFISPLYAHRRPNIFGSTESLYMENVVIGFTLWLAIASLLARTAKNKFDDRPTQYRL